MPATSHFKRVHADLTIDEVEALWAPIAEEDDWQPFAEKVSPYNMRAARWRCAQIPQIDGEALQVD